MLVTIPATAVSAMMQERLSSITAGQYHQNTNRDHEQSPRHLGCTSSRINGSFEPAWSDLVFRFFVSKQIESSCGFLLSRFRRTSIQKVVN